MNRLYLRSKLWWRNLIETPLRLTIYLSVLLLVVTLVLSSNLYAFNFKELFIQLVAEAHGIIADVLVFGVLLVWIAQKRERLTKINEARQELNDLRLYFLLRQQSYENTIDSAQMKAAAFAIVTGGNEAAYTQLQYLVGEIDKMNSQVYHDNSYVALRLFTIMKSLNTFGVTKLELSNIVLSNAPLDGINLTGSLLNSVQMQGTLLKSAKLVKVQASHSNISGANLTGASCAESIWNNSTLVKTKYINVDFSNCKFIGADASNSVFINCNFSGSNLLNMKMDGASFRGCNLTNCMGITVNQLNSLLQIEDCKFDAELKSKLFNTLFNRSTTGAKAVPQEIRMQVQKQG